MDDLKIIFARNLISLRKQLKITQAELAEKINYSDKAVSKWERGESLPDVAVLMSIAELFGVNLDYLVTHHEDPTTAIEQTDYAKKIKAKNHFMISAITIFAIIVCEVTAFVTLQSINSDLYNLVYCFVYPLPVSAMLSFIFSSIWGNKRLTFIFVSAFIWLLLLDVFLILAHFISPFPLIFLIGIPAEIITMLSFKIIRLKK